MQSIFLLFVTTFVSASAIELTPSNWDHHTVGKTIFVKFFAPWCGHCKKIKPAWDQLMNDYKDSSTILVADVDCIGEGKPLCDTHGVKGFPTIKFGAGVLEDYKQGRSLEELRKFTSELTAPCNVFTMEHCTDEQQAQITEHNEKSMEELQGLINVHSSTVANIEHVFTTGVKGLQDQFETMRGDKENALAQLGDVGILKSLLGTPKNEL